jgi:hypothetical protein
MLTISKVHRGRRVRGSGLTRAEALANLDRSIRRSDRLACLRRVATFVSIIAKPVLAAAYIRRMLGIQ